MFHMDVHSPAKTVHCLLVVVKGLLAALVEQYFGSSYCVHLSLKVTKNNRERE